MTIDTNGVRGFMRSVRRGKGGETLDRETTGLDEAQSKRLLDGVDRALGFGQTDLGRVPAPQDPDLYGGRRPSVPGQRLAAISSEVEASIAEITEEMSRMAELIEDGQRKHASLNDELMRLTAMLDRATAPREKDANPETGEA